MTSLEERAENGLEFRDFTPPREPVEPNELGIDVAVLPELAEVDRRANGDAIEMLPVVVRDGVCEGIFDALPGARWDL